MGWETLGDGVRVYVTNNRVDHIHVNPEYRSHYDVGHLRVLIQRHGWSDRSLSTDDFESALRPSKPRYDEYRRATARIIREQLGNRALTMWGAREFIDEDGALKFKVGRNPEGVTHIRVFLRGDDTYNVEAWKIRGTSVKQVGFHQVVYVEDLRRTIQDLTGLRYSL